MPAPLPAAAPPTVSVPPMPLDTIAGDLATLLDRETALVRALKIADIAPLQGEKRRLTALFQKSLADAGGGKALATKPQWVVAGKRLADAAIANERALRAGRAASECLIAAVVDAVKQTRRPLAAYSARKGAQRLPPLAGIALDRRF